MSPPNLKNLSVEDSERQTSNYRRRRRHPFRQFFFVVFAAGVIIGLVFWMRTVSRSKEDTAPVAAPVVSGEDAGIQFK